MLSRRGFSGTLRQKDERLWQEEEKTALGTSRSFKVTRAEMGSEGGLGLFICCHQLLLFLVLWPGREASQIEPLAADSSCQTRCQVSHVPLEFALDLPKLPSVQTGRMESKEYSGTTKLQAPHCLPHTTVSGQWPCNDFNPKVSGKSHVRIHLWGHKP